jgi:hypothetical protein
MDENPASDRSKYSCISGKYKEIKKVYPKLERNVSKNPKPRRYLFL